MLMRNKNITSKLLSWEFGSVRRQEVALNKKGMLCKRKDVEWLGILCLRIMSKSM